MTKPPDAEALDQRVLVHAPFGRDGAMCIAALEHAKLAAVLCESMSETLREIERGTAVVLITQESLTPAALEGLSGQLARQPAWSDLPVVVVLAKGQGDTAGATKISSLGNVTVLERPLSRLTMISAARAALRARRRQYEVRDLLARREGEIRQRDQFLAMLGHELRNPLTAISNAAELFNIRLPKEESLRRPLQVIRRQVDHLARLVDDLLDVSRVTSGKVALDRRVLDLREALKSAIGPMEASFGNHHLSLSVDLGKDALHVAADATRIEQVFTNLLTNALKYTPSGGRVHVKAMREGDAAVVTFTDSGIGLTPEMIASVFDLFVQSERALDRAQGGLGIGLTIVRSLLQLHEGTVTASSPGLGLGSTFTVTLPLVEAASSPSHANAQAAAPSPARLRMLVVEDNEDNRELLKELLEALQFDVQTAPDGHAGLEKAVDLRPDVALIDIGLPGLDGYQVARGVRSALGTAIRLVALTGYGQPEDIKRSVAAGFDAHVTKPPSLEKLLAAIVVS